MKKKQFITALLIILAIIIIDQLIKIYIKTHFVLHESREVASWFYLSFIENNGMAYGLEIGSKVALTCFRIVAVLAVAVYMYRKVSRVGSSWISVVLVSMIIGGAIGNIIDCVFYGRWFTSSVGRVAQWADEASGIMPSGEWFQGRVVDMFYFPLIHFNWPDWVPSVDEMIHLGSFTFQWPRWLPCNNEPFMFFKPVFNFADAAISVGVALFIVLAMIDAAQERKRMKRHA